MIIWKVLARFVVSGICLAIYKYYEGYSLLYVISWIKKESETCKNF